METITSLTLATATDICSQKWNMALSFCAKSSWQMELMLVFRLVISVMQTFVKGRAALKTDTSLSG